MEQFTSRSKDVSFAFKQNLAHVVDLVSVCFFGLSSGPSFSSLQALLAESAASTNSSLFVAALAFQSSFQL